eukprot:3691329-Prymnesium_polylepis.1
MPRGLRHCDCDAPVAAKRPGASPRRSRASARAGQSCRHTARRGSGRGRCTRSAASRSTGRGGR